MAKAGRVRFTYDEIPSSEELRRASLARKVEHADVPDMSGTVEFETDLPEHVRVGVLSAACSTAGGSWNWREGMVDLMPSPVCLNQ
jgi:hypothetical protein